MYLRALVMLSASLALLFTGFAVLWSIQPRLPGVFIPLGPSCLLASLCVAHSWGFRQLRPSPRVVDLAGLSLIGLGLFRLALGVALGEPPYHPAHPLVLLASSLVSRRARVFLIALGAGMLGLLGVGLAAGRLPGLPFAAAVCLALALAALIHRLVQILNRRVAVLLARTRARLAHSQARAAFAALRLQLESHTLFNALNLIAGFIDSEPRMALEAIRRLSQLLRRIQEGQGRDRWSLDEEFAVLADIAWLQDLRFGGRFVLDLDVEGGMEERSIPPLLLMPLVENALIHGFRGKTGPCRLEIQARDGVVTVRDDGVGWPPAWKEGGGLRMVRGQIEAAGGALAILQAHPGCMVEVRLP